MISKKRLFPLESSDPHLSSNRSLHIPELAIQSLRPTELQVPLSRRLVKKHKGPSEADLAHASDKAQTRDSATGGDSAQGRALLQLRELILSGELAGGMRIAELAMVKRLGLSRTPIRAALQRLEQEGLLEPLSSVGYVVKSFSENDILDAIDLRGTLEGLLARRAAERGVAAAVLLEARQCLDSIDQLLSQSSLNDTAWSSYVSLNEKFHALLTELAESPVIAQQLDRALALPFASASAFVVAQANSMYARDMLIVAQDQHRQVLDAIANSEGARAEAIMREHSRLAQRNLRQVLQGDGDQSSTQKLIRLLRRRGAHR